MVELVVATAIGILTCVAVMLLSIYSSRSFAAILNYVQMDEHSQRALDHMSRELRQARRLTAFTSTSLTLQDVDNQQLIYCYDPGQRSLLRISQGVTNQYLSDCDELEFSKFQRTSISNTFDAYEPAFVTNTKLVQITWTCSRKILGAKLNTESVQSAKVVLRNR